MSWVRRLLRVLTGWRFWLGFVLPVAAIVYTLRGVDAREVARGIGAVSAWFVVAMMSLQLLVLVARALRWGHMTRALEGRALPLGSLFRATSVGFMAINVLPLRIGELARPWFLARETGIAGSAALGTIVLERAIDFASLLLIGSFVLYLHTQALPPWVRTGALVLALVSLVPFALIAALRLNREATLEALARLLSRLPEAVRDRVVRTALELLRGLNALQGRRSVTAVLLYSALLWGVLIPGGYALGLLAFGVELDFARFALAVFTAEVFTAVAVSAPSAPGFFGVFHFACREALALFGVSAAVGVAYGTLLHLTYWLPVTAMGLVIAARAGLQLRDLSRPRPGLEDSSAR